MYYIFEIQHRTDGINNVQQIVGRTTLNSALSYYHERFSKMTMNEEFTSVALYLCDENFNKIDHAIVTTMYKPPGEQAVEEPTEEVVE